ncbi:MAG: hypothetical protein R2864_02065 [Syntrophotaleaceae bacterium]
MLALQRNLSGKPAVDQTVSLWQAPDSFVPALINGTLTDSRMPSPERRNHFLALLRRSWPNRRFRLPAATPTWTWQLLHLLGMASADAVIELRLPNGWLATPYGLTVLELIQSQFGLDQLSDQGDDWLILRLHKAADRDGLTTLIHSDTRRTLEWRWLNSHHPSLLTLALYLPEPLLGLLEDQRLCQPTEQAWPDQCHKAVFAFTRSPLGQALWQLLGEGRPLPRRTLLQKELLRTGLPLPSTKILEQWQRSMNNAGADKARQSAFNRELVLWLGNDLSALVSGPWAEETEVVTAAPTQRGAAELSDIIVQEVFVDGLPNFPEHYLYDYYRPEMRRYEFTPPLSRVTEFFGRVELIDRNQRTLELDNPDAARALQLCAATGKTATALPVEEQIVTAIVQRFLTDLHTLHQALARCCHRHCSDPQQAEALTKEIWNRQDLPPWKTVIELSNL